MGTISTRVAEARPAGSGARHYSGVSRLFIELSCGNVLCRDTNLEPGQVRIVWRITRNGESLNGDSDAIEIRDSLDEGRLRIWDHHLRKWRNGNPDIDMRIQVHPQISVAASLGSGEVELDVPLIAGASLGSGGLQLNGRLFEHANAQLGSGRLTGEVEVRDGEHRLAVGTGEIHLFLAESSSCTVRASVGVGAIEAEGIKVRRDLRPLGGTVRGRLGVGDGALSLDVGTGNIHLEAE